MEKTALEIFSEAASLFKKSLLEAADLIEDGKWEVTTTSHWMTIKIPLPTSSNITTPDIINELRNIAASLNI